MTRAEILERVRNGETSHTEFKEDAVSPEKLACEISALLNFEGGAILLGVEDRASAVVGLTRSREQIEEWVMNVARDRIRPSIIPSWHCVAMDDGKVVGVVGLSPDSPDKPYKARVKGAWRTFIRVGTTTREATREEEGRLYQSASVMAGLLLFGHSPNRRLPQAGITATAFKGSEKDYDTEDEELIRGPLVPAVSDRRRSPQQIRSMGVSAKRLLGRRVIVDTGSSTGLSTSSCATWAWTLGSKVPEDTGRGRVRSTRFGKP